MQNCQRILFRLERWDLKPEPVRLGRNCSRFVSRTPGAIGLNSPQHFAIYSNSSHLAVSQSAVSLIRFRNRLGALTHIPDLSIHTVDIISLSYGKPSLVPSPSRTT